MVSLRVRIILAAAVLGLGLGQVRGDDLAAAPAYSNPHPEKYLFEDKLSPGMKGYGLTVMKGSKIERFDVEIIDVMKNFDSGRNAILVKCTGLGLEESGIIAGMSGSPVYIDGKLIGAVAFGWGGAKQPIGGVQPIRQMLSIPAVERKGEGEAGRAQAAAGGRWASGSSLAKAAMARGGWSALAKHLVAQDAGMAKGPAAPSSLTTLATPVMMSGSSAQSLAYAREMFAGTGLVPMQAGGGGAVGEAPRLGGLKDTADEKMKLAPGSPIAIPLISGDMDMSAIGTITEVDGNKIWAFGHSMFADGASQLPIATGYIYSILPSVGTSFKIGASVTPTGGLVTDENTGIVGFTGAVPKMIPVTLTLQRADGSQKSVSHYQIVQHPRMTAEMLGTAIDGAIVSQRNLPKQYTLEVKGTAEFAGTQLPLRSLSTSDQFDIADILLPVATLSENPLKNLKLEKIELVATIDPQNRAAEIRRIHLDRTSVQPGGTITVTVDYATFQKPVQSQTLLVKVPADAPEGDFDLIVGAANAMRMNDVETMPHIADPENIGALVSTVKRITGYGADHLFARLVLDLDGAAVHGNAKRSLPASRLAVLASNRQTGVTPIIRTVTTDEPADGVFADANETLHITIAKDAQGRYHEEIVDVMPSGPTKKAGGILEPKKPGKGPAGE